jgi:hypothetical protein
VSHWRLATVYILSSNCHGQNARMHILHDDVVITKFVSVDGFAAIAVVVCVVTTLAHEP